MGIQQARKPRSYASLKLRPSDSLTHLLTRVKSRATSVAKKLETPEVADVCVDTWKAALGAGDDAP